jgi:hypothetical protein
VSRLSSVRTEESQQPARVVAIERGWLTAVYQCDQGHVWLCGWAPFAAPYPDVCDLDRESRRTYLPVWVFCSPTDHRKVQQMVGGIDP